jgi:hypothetical protein
MKSNQSRWFLLFFVIAASLSACQPAAGPASTENPAYPNPYPQVSQAVPIQPVNQNTIYPFPYPQPVQPTLPPPAEQDLSYPYPQPNQYPGPGVTSEVPWSRAEEMIMGGEIARVMQTHDLKVYLTSTEGWVVMTVEPEIDAVLDVIDRCGDPCKKILIATE